MAVCVRCGASTSAKQCPRCGGETSPYAAPRPEPERAPAAPAPALTTTRLPVVPGSPFPDLPRAGEATQTTGAAQVQPPSGFLAPATEHPAVQPALQQPSPAPASAAATTPASSPFTGRSVAVVLGLVALLVVLGALAWWQVHRSAGIGTVPRPAITQALVQLPAGASVCAGDDAPAAGRQVYVGNTLTTCGLAQNVRAALGDHATPVTVQAVSPRSGRTYAMSCTGAPTATCTGGSGAVVYLPPAGARVVVATR